MASHLRTPQGLEEVKRPFTPEAAENASRANYCKWTCRVISGATIKRMETHKALDTAVIIDLCLGYTTSKLKEIHKKELIATSDASGITNLEFTLGAFRSFTFGNDMSVQTLNPKAKSKKSTRLVATSFKFDQESNYPLESAKYDPNGTRSRMDCSDTLGSNSDEETGGDRKDVTMKTMEFKLPPGGLNAGVAQEDDSKDSHLCPMSLVLKFLSKEKGVKEGGDSTPIDLTADGSAIPAVFSSLQDKMTRTLTDAGGSKEEQEKILLTMLTNIMGPTVEIAVVDKPATKNSEPPPHVTSEEKTTDKATSHRRSIPSSMNIEPTGPPGKGGPPPMQHTRGEGHKSGAKGDSSSIPE